MPSLTNCECLENIMVVLTENAVNIQYYLTVTYIKDLLCIAIYCMCVHVFINQWVAYSLFHKDFIFAQDSNLFMDERILSLCLGQISPQSLQELQALTKFHQWLEGWLTLVLN